MYNINFLMSLENQLEKQLSGRVILVKSTDILNGWRKLSKKETKKRIEERINIEEKFFIIYEDGECVYKELIDILNILKDDYKCMLDNNMIYLITGIYINNNNQLEYMIKNIKQLYTIVDNCNK